MSERITVKEGLSQEEWNNMSLRAQNKRLREIVNLSVEAHGDLINEHDDRIEKLEAALGANRIVESAYKDNIAKRLDALEEKQTEQKEEKKECSHLDGLIKYYANCFQLKPEEKSVVYHNYVSRILEEGLKQPKFKVGDVWETRNGSIATITKININDESSTAIRGILIYCKTGVVFVKNNKLIFNKCWWQKDGQYDGTQKSILDLIKKLS